MLTEQLPGGSRKQRAVGVRLLPSGSHGAVIEVRAPVVVASSGSLHNPALLMRSGITCGGNVGKHLHLHAATTILARFPKKVDFKATAALKTHLDKDECSGSRLCAELAGLVCNRREWVLWQDTTEDPQEGRIQAWQGPNMSTYSREGADWSGGGYGPLVSVAPVRSSLIHFTHHPCQAASSANHLMVWMQIHAGLVGAGSHWESALAFR